MKVPPRRPASPSTGDEWPSVGYEQVDWKPRTTYAMPARAAREASGPYRAALVPAIATSPAAPVSADALALATEASAEIARFDGEVGADIAPFAAILLRSESAASSQIENLTASAKAIALAEFGDDDRQNARVIVANTEAMHAAIALAHSLDADAILAMHAALLSPTEPEMAGKWREEQVWIGGGGFSPHGASFVPPQHQHVRPAIDDLVQYMAREDVPTLVQAAIAHAQFETIHPFPDGNGRTGRALVHSLLRGKGLTRRVTVPVSAGLLTDTSGYFDALGAYRQGDPEPIVTMMSTASFNAINNGRQLVDELHSVQRSWGERITARRDSAARRVAARLLAQPVVDSPSIQRDLGVSAPAALTAIEHLVTVGILTKVGPNRRGRRYVATDVLRALDQFAARAGRRGG
jgi:Fic family protein